MSGTQYPSKRRALTALAVAPIAPVIVIFVLDAIDRASTSGIASVSGAALLAGYMLIVAEMLAFVFGGLALVVLWHRTRVSLPISMLVGAIVAAGPIALVVALMSIAPSSGTYNASYNGRPTVVDNQKTPYGLWRDAVSFAYLFGLGALGGSAFWVICRTEESEGAADE